MIFYDYLLNIDISIYTSDQKERGLLESMIIRLEDVKKVLALLYTERNEFVKNEERLLDWFEK
jgi:hypothetical protein